MDKSELKYKNRAFFQKIKFQCDFCPKPGINKIVYPRDKEDITSPQQPAENKFSPHLERKQHKYLQKLQDIFAK